HCEGSEAKQSTVRQRRKLDCFVRFAPRNDDRCQARPPQSQLSSPGLTGRSSTPRPRRRSRILRNTGSSAFAGDDGSKSGDDGSDQSSSDCFNRAIATPSRASWSARSLTSWPAWPLTQCQRTSCVFRAASRRCHRSTFLTGFLSEVRQPFLFQLLIQPVMPWRTYWLSV